jgi:DNA-binding transcriptional regulator GbsR (MarR family)
MELEIAKEQFVQTWGTLGTNWGISRTMAQVHALLLVSAEALSTEEVMDRLQISRGNANMTLRDLMDWGLAHKVLKTGERKEFFVAEKDIWEVAKCIARERKRRELDQMKKAIDQLANVPGSPDDKDYAAYISAVKGIQEFAGQVDSLLTRFTNSDRNWFFRAVAKLFG